MRKNILSLGLCVAFLASCDMPKTPLSNEVDVNLPPLSPIFTASGITLAVFPKDSDLLEAGKEVIIASTEAGMLISGGIEKPAPSGKTGGAFFRTGPELEGQVNGHKIRIYVTATGQNGSSMKVSYSTNDVGNSGWKTFALSDTSQEYSFDYMVPLMNKGKNDFIGIIATTPESTVLVSHMSYEIISD